MSHLAQDITYLNDQLFQENKKLRQQAEYDNELIANLGKRLKKADETIQRLEDELNELRRMQQPSNASGGSSAASVPATLSGSHARSPMQRPSVGD